MASAIWIRTLLAFLLLAGAGQAQEKEKGKEKDKDKAAPAPVVKVVPAPEPPAQLLPVRGLCIAAPPPARLDEFIAFLHKELAGRGGNTLVLRVDYAYQFECHPELRDQNALSKAEVKKLVTACRADGIRLIPQINLLGHQSWQSTCGKLLQAYPDFDETPGVKLPEKYAWPNADRLYCKSYCPLHPKVHDVVFAAVDELCDAFEAQAFHAGMDEVFYLGEYDCPRCSGRDRAELFADEVRLVRDHLARKKRALWIWGDRLLDGRTTGLGEWEASFNGTARAIDLIPKDVLICDWHYEAPEPTPVYFALKGFQVVACPWRWAEVGVQQVQDMTRLRLFAGKAAKERYQGVLQTVWEDTGAFLDAYSGKTKPAAEKGDEAACFRAVLAELKAK